MAYHSGTVTGHNALLDELRDFLTNAGGFTVNGVALTSGEEWATERDDTNGSTREVIFRGQGNDGLQNIYCGIQTYENPSLDLYNWRIMGMTGYDSGATFLNQPGAALVLGTKCVCDMSFWSSSIDFWFYADGQVVWIVANVSTTYQIGGFGYGTVFGAPSTYPYPLFWCGTSPGDVRDGIQEVYTSGAPRHQNILDPAEGAAFLRWVDGGVYPIANDEADGGGTPASTVYFQCWPYNSNYNKQVGTLFNGTFDVDPFSNFVRDLQPINDVVYAFPLVAFSESGNLGTFAFRFPRVLNVPGNGLAPESTVTIDGNTYRVFPDISRISNASYLGFIEV